MLKNYQRCFKYGRYKGLDEDKAYDFAGWFVTKFPDTREFRNEWALGSYFRETVGDKRTKCYDDKRTLSLGLGTGKTSQDDDDYQPKDVVCERRDIGEFESHLDARGEIEKLRPKDRLIMFMISDGYKMKEIADLFGVTDRRISQIVSNIRAKRILREKKKEIEELKSSIRSWNMELNWMTL